MAEYKPPKFVYGRGDRIVKSDHAKWIKMERMPDEVVDKGYPLSARFGGEQSPTIHQSYTTGGILYDDFTAPEHVDDYEV